jgi:uncharacterized membrane protein
VADPHESPETHAQQMLLERMLFFSDAVFAIVLTLLALQLKLPDGVDDAHLLDGLFEIKGEMISFALSFALVGVFWIRHMTMLRALARFDWVVAVVNLVFLFTVTLTPFACSLVGHDGNAGQAWRLYCLTVVVIGVAQVALLVVCHRDEPRLVHRAHHGRLWHRLARSSSPAVAFAIGLGLSEAGFRSLSQYCWLLVPLLMMLAGLVERRSAVRKPPAPEAEAG